MRQHIIKRNIKLLATVVVLSTVVIIACSKKLETTDKNNPTVKVILKQRRSCRTE